MEAHITNIVTDIAFIIIAAAVMGYLTRILKQPLLIGYIMAGLVIGPFGLNYISNENTILAISELGITFLLFLVGLELNINRIKEVGKVVVVGGLLQVFLTALFGLIISYSIGFSTIQSLYLGIVLAFSSTLVVVKHLSDKREIDTLHGRIIIGILVLQDLVAIMAISMLPAINSMSFSNIGYAVLSGISLFALAYVLNKFVLRRIFDFSAKNAELLFLSSLAVCFVFSYLATLMGFSVTIGAFIAGVIIANLPYSIDIIGRVRPLTTFFSALFFVALGMQIVPNTIPGMIVPLLILTVVAVLLKPLIIFPLTYFFGYSKKVSFVTAITLGQVSEFSLIIVAQGIMLNHLSGDILSLIIALTVITMGVSSYFANNGISLFYRYEQKLSFIDSIFRGRKDKSEDKKDVMEDAQVIINGYDNVEGTLMEKFMNLGKKVLIVDNDPDVIRRLREVNIKCVYGDLAEHDIFDRINIEKVEVIMSSIPDYHDNLFITRKVREVNKKAIIIITANRVSESFDLYNAGADYVVIPHIEGEKQVAVLLEDFNKDISKVLSTKIKHIEQLRKRQSMKEKIHNGTGSFFEDIDNMLKNAAQKINESKSLINLDMPQKKRKKTDGKAMLQAEKKEERQQVLSQVITSEKKEQAGQEA